MRFGSGFAAMALVALTACEEGTTNFGQFGFAGTSGRGVRTIALLGGDVQVQGPDGYCVDRRASDGRRGFAVLVGCAVVSRDDPVLPNLDGLITVQFGMADTASVTDNEEAFATFLESEAGRGLLAANGDATNVAAVSTVTDRAAVLVRFQDLSGPSLTGTSGPQWRGFLDVNGRLVTLSVLSFERRVLSRAEGQRLLTVAMAQIAEVNTDATPTE